MGLYIGCSVCYHRLGLECTCKRIITTTSQLSSLAHRNSFAVMKVHWQTTALLLAASAAARDATVHILGAPSSKDTTPPSVLDASSARLVFAQLLGLSEFHNLGDVSSDTLQGLNAFSAGPQALFGQESAINQQRSFVIVEGYDHVKGLSSNQATCKIPSS